MPALQKLSQVSIFLLGCLETIQDLEGPAFVVDRENAFGFQDFSFHLVSSVCLLCKQRRERKSNLFEAWGFFQGSLVPGNLVISKELGFRAKPKWEAPLQLKWWSSSLILIFSFCFGLRLAAWVPTPRGVSHKTLLFHFLDTATELSLPLRREWRANGRCRQKQSREAYVPRRGGRQ